MKNPAENFSTTLGITIPVNLAVTLDRFCEENDTTRSKTIRDALAYYFERQTG